MDIKNILSTKISKNEEKLTILKRKRENIDFEIKNLELKILNQKCAERNARKQTNTVQVETKNVSLFSEEEK